MGRGFGVALAFRDGNGTVGVEVDSNNVYEVVVAAMRGDPTCHLEALAFGGLVAPTP